MIEIFKSSILAGMFISLGCIVNLTVGGYLGAILFSFGLLSVVHYKLKLYTGTIGFFMNLNGFFKTFLVLFGNIVGCLLISLIAHVSLDSVVDASTAILEKRLALSWYDGILLGSLCGFIMTTAVKFGKEGKYLPLLFGVPLFILSGFLHSIADAFYYLTSSTDFVLSNSFHIIFMYIMIVIGNALGCNFYRIVFMRL